MQTSQSMSPRKRFLILGSITLLIILLIMAGLGLFGGSNRPITAVKLRCIATQDVTPFGDQILYYDGMTLYCLRSNGYEHWSYPVGQNASFSCTDTVIAAWTGTQLHIIDKDGHSSYNENLPDTIQFARLGTKYVAVVIGNDLSPTLIIKDLQGTNVDSEANAYKDMILLDLGFFSDGEYLWTTALDVYGSVPDTTLNTYHVSVSTSGGISLGENLVSAVIYAGTKLNVISTRHLRQYDYRGTLDPSGTVLVYGWQLIDHAVINNSAMLLFTPTSISDAQGRINQLRLLWGKTDKQYFLPAACVGAALYNKRIYAFAQDMIYRADLNARRFTPISLPGDLSSSAVTDYLGMLKNGVALVACNNEVYAVTLP